MEVAQQAYDGAVLLVSHDRHMLRNTVEELLLVRDGQVEPYSDDLEGYEKWILAGLRSAAHPNEAARDTSRRERRQQAAAARDRLRPLQKKIASLETAIGKNEKALESVRASLADTDLYAADRKDELADLLRREGELKQETEALEEDWLNCQEELEAIS
jgi:ATP-binding cassette subfamily F protein 3